MISSLFMQNLHIYVELKTSSLIIIRINWIVILKFSTLKNNKLHIINYFMLFERYLRVPLPAKS